MKLITATAALFAATMGLTAANDPYVGYIYPSGMQRGTTNRLIVGGQQLWGKKTAHFSNPGIHVLNIEKVPNFSPPTGMQRKHLKNWLDGIAAGRTEEPPKPNDPHISEWRTNSWWSALDTLDEGQIAIVEHDLYTPRNSLQATPSLRQRLLVTVAIDPDAKPGWGTLSISGINGISAPRPFFVSELPHVAEPLYVPPHRHQPGPALADLAKCGGMILDGQILPGSTDAFRLRLAAGRHYRFNVTARELQPYIGDAVPGFFNASIALKDLRGNVVAQADDNSRFRPDPVLEFTPTDDCEYLLQIHDVLYRGRADFVYSICVRQGNAVCATAEAEGAWTSPCASPGRAPDGIVSAAGAISRKTFVVDSPGPRVLEVTARRLGSPLDAVLTLRREPGGPVLAQWDDVTNTVFTGTIPQEEYDPVGMFDFKEPGEYVAEVTDRTRHGGDAYVWWLDVRNPSPGFTVLSSRSTLPLKRGQPVKVDFHVIRKDGFDGAVTIEFDGPIRAKNCVVKPGENKATASLFYARRQPLDAHPVKLFAKATIGGREVRVPVIPCDEYEQAFAWHHLVPAKHFLLSGGR